MFPATIDLIEVDAMPHAIFQHGGVHVRGVQGGVFSPNGARNQEGLDSVEYGDEPRVQQQVVPLSAAAGIPVPAAPPALGPALSDAATKSYQAAVSRDIEALTARAKRPRPASRKPVIRKIKANGLEPHAHDPQEQA
jgi:hypothetical protein